MSGLALVVENDDSTRKLLAVVLTRLGFEVDAVANGKDALVLLGSIDYDLMVFDLMVPGASGEDLLDWLRQHRPVAIERSLVLSSAPRLHLEQVQDWYPKARVIRKPFELDELIEYATAVRRDRPAVSISTAGRFARRSIMAGAKAGLLVRKSGSEISLVHHFGYEPSVVEPWFPLSASAHLPLCECLREGRPQWMPSLTAAAPEFPHLAELWRSNHIHALATVPLIRGGEVLGAAGWSFHEPRAFDEQEQRAFTAIAEDASTLLDLTQST
jgi:CheY-like chemotaxis protein